MHTKITDYTVNGKCSSCGACCTDLLPLSQGEVIKIKKYILKHNIKEQRHNALSGIDMTCPFRDDVNHKCTIYEIRPAICKQFICNHSISDIQKSKMYFHKINRVVLMRKEFFGSNEEQKFFSNMLTNMFL